MQTQSKFFDDLAKVMTGAAGAAQGAAKEMETLFRQQAERLIGELDLVTRDEFAAMKAVAQKTFEENEALAERVADLEKTVAKLNATKKPASKRQT